jgi:hypothetical protein
MERVYLNLISAMIIVSLLFIANLYSEKALAITPANASNITELIMKTNLTDEDKADVIKALLSNGSDDRPVPTTNATGVSATNVINSIFSSYLPHLFIIIIFLIIFVPLVIDMILAYRKKSNESTNKENNLVSGMPGLYRSLMTFGLIVLVGTVIFYLLALITLNINNSTSPMLQSLIDILKSLGTILGTGLTTIIAFYFGVRGAESAAEKATAATEKATAAAKPDSDVKAPLTVLNTKPADKAPNVLPLDSLVTATFSEPMSSTTINKNTFTVKIADQPTTIEGTVGLASDGKTATYDSKEDFSPNTTYVATISTGAKDLAGNALASAKEWSFTTGNRDKVPPKEDKTNGGSSTGRKSGTTGSLVSDPTLTSTETDKTNGGSSTGRKSGTTGSLVSDPK